MNCKYLKSLPMEPSPGGMALVQFFECLNEESYRKGDSCCSIMVYNCKTQDSREYQTCDYWEN